MEWLTGHFDFGNLFRIEANVRPSGGGFEMGLNFSNLNQKRASKFFPEYQVLSIPTITVEYYSGTGPDNGDYLITSEVPFIGFFNDKGIQIAGSVDLKPEKVSKYLRYFCVVTPDQWSRMREIVQKVGVLYLKLLISFSLSEKTNYSQSSISLWAPEIIVNISKANLEEFIGVWTKVRYSVRDLPDNLPEGVLMDLIEASKCIDIEASRAAVVMLRRAIQEALSLKEPDKVLSLYKQIDQLKEKKLISDDVASLAHGIRFLGNFGAHPDDDLLNDVSFEDAKLAYQVIMKILKQLFSG